MKYLALVAAILATLLLGCGEKEVSPLVSGIVRQINPPGHERKLNAQQLAQLTQWLGNQRSRWQRCFFTPPPGPVLTATFNHADGSVSIVDVMPMQSDQAMLLASHPSGSTLHDQPCTHVTLSKQEVTTLLTILGYTNVNSH